jgi:ABC-type transport system involved in multi-copper enzyme maturation permease subunit
LGPLFYYELVRLARKGRSTLLRCAYALALLVALFLAYRARFPGQDLWSTSFTPEEPLAASEMSRLAEGFVYAILWAQTLAVFVLSPVYVGTAIAEERERGTLDLLVLSHLTDREIVLGKLAARSVYMGGVLLAGLPLLALTQLWGGVDFRLLLAAFLASGLNVLSFGAVCLSVSVSQRTAAGAVVISYSNTVGKVFFWSILAATPPEMFRVLSEELAGPASGLKHAALMPSPWAGRGILLPLAIGIAVNGIAILLCGSVAVVGFRRNCPPLDEKTAAAAVPPRRLPRNLPPVGDSPLLWKETSHGVGTSAAAALERLFREAPVVGLLLLGVLAGMLLSARREARDHPDAVVTLTGILRGTVVFFAGLWCGMVAFRAAGGISREREARTLDVLLTLPVSRTSLAGSKWLGAVLSDRVFGYLLAFLAVEGVLGGGLHPLGVFLLILAVASAVALLASFGTWLSLVSPNSQRSRVVMTLVLIVLGGGLNGLAALLGLSPHPSWPGLLAEYATNATGTWWFLTFTWDDLAAARAAGDAAFTARLATAALGSLVFASLAGAFWLITRRRFETKQTG